MDNVLNTNNRGWLKKCTGLAGQWHYLASGAHRDVYKGVYLRGPRKDQPCVKKVFKTGSVVRPCASVRPARVILSMRPETRDFVRA